MYTVYRRENYVYETQIAQDIDIVIPVHYYSESGPIERDAVHLL